MPYWTRALPLAVAVFFAALCFSTRTLTVRTYNWIIATPVVLILLLYCVPVIAGYGPSKLLCNVMPSSDGSRLHAGTVDNRTCTLVSGWNEQPSFGGVRPSDMASFISHASLYCSVHAVYTDISVLMLGLWCGIDPMLAALLVVMVWVLLAQREGLLYESFYHIDFPTPLALHAAIVFVTVTMAYVQADTQRQAFAAKLLQVHFREQRIEQLAQEKERLQYVRRGGGGEAKATPATSTDTSRRPSRGKGDCDDARSAT